MHYSIENFIGCSFNSFSIYYFGDKLNYIYFAERSYYLGESLNYFSGGFNYLIGDFFGELFDAEIDECLLYY
jgi:hypothetical protein